MSHAMVVNDDASTPRPPRTEEEQASTMRISSSENMWRRQNISVSKQRRRRQPWMLLFLIFHGEMLSSMSLLPSHQAGWPNVISQSSHSPYDNSNVQIVVVRRPLGGSFGFGHTRSIRLYGQTDNKNDEGEILSSDDSGNLWNRITNSFSSGDDDKKKEKKEKKKRKKAERRKESRKASNTQGSESVLQGVVRRFRESRDSKKSEKEVELRKKLEKEIDDEKAGLPNIIDTSYLSSAFDIFGEVTNQMKDTATSDTDAKDRVPNEVKSARDVELDAIQKQKLEVEARRLRERQLAEERYQKRLERQAEITRQRQELIEQRAKALQEDRIKQEEKRKELQRLRLEASQREKDRLEQSKIEQKKKREEAQRQTRKRREELRRQRQKLEEEEARLRARRERDASIRAVAKSASSPVARDGGGSSTTQAKQEEKVGAGSNSNRQNPTDTTKDSSSRSGSGGQTDEKKKKQEKSRDRNDKNKDKMDGDDGKESSSNPWSKLVASVLEGKKRDEEWIPVARKWAIAPGEIKPIEAAGLDLLLVASKDGAKLHCVANACPHLGTPLELAMLERRPIESSSDPTKQEGGGGIVVPDILEETLIANLLAQDGCEDCIVCPLHHTAFALESGEVRGEWCPYPPVIGKMMGTVKTKEKLPVFDTRVKGKDIQVRLNTPVK